MAKQNTVVITGGSGFVGVCVAKKLIERNSYEKIILTDIIQSRRIDAVKDKVVFVKADLTSAQACCELVTEEVGMIYHFASLVSGGAERDFEAGLNANLYAPLNLLEACRKKGRCPKFIFPSSIAAFGGKDLPEEINDYTFQHPQNSYGVAKVIIEQLLNDYSRKGYIDGRGVRLPAIIVRDEANTAASGYASAIIREPLAGRNYVCQVTEKTRIPVLSIRKCVELLVALGELPPGSLGDYRTINGPGLSPRAAEMAEAVRNCGLETLGDIRFEPEQAAMKIVNAWPKIMHFDRAKSLGLEADESIERIVSDYLKEKKLT